MFYECVLFFPVPSHCFLCLSGCLTFLKVSVRSGGTVCVNVVRGKELCAFVVSALVKII